MLTYKAGYKFDPDGVHAEVLDFAGAISCGTDLDEPIYLNLLGSIQPITADAMDEIG
jgi:hypothetical protein